MEKMLEKLILPAIFLGVIYATYNKTNAYNNLENNSFWAGNDQFEKQNGKAFVTNKDIDGDGRLETVFRYLNEEGNYTEIEIRRRKDGLPEVIYPTD